MNEHVERNDHIASETASAAGAGLNAGTPAGHVHDVIVVGGGPCGATAAHDLARQGYDVVLLDREGRIKPCGGAVPPRLIKDFEIPDELIVARAKSARIISPSNRTVDMPIDGGYVGMVDREHFDAWLRARAEDAGATRYAGTFERFERRADGTAQIVFTPKQRRGPGDASPVRTGPATATLAARFVIAADGARSKVTRQAMPKVGEPKCVFAYHEIISAPQSADCSDVLPANAGDGG
ncbi:MAG: FAD-dependent oxidoreductase, partial [Pseudomonadota bacterium]